MVELLGHSCDLAEDGAEAVAACEEHTYDAILMDIQMPKLNGVEATHAIRRMGGSKQPHIIAFTAYAFREDKERYLASGMDAFLSKPVRLEALLEALKQVHPIAQRCLS